VVLLASSDDATTQVFGAEASVTQPRTGENITAAPSFADEAAGDLHELPGSPTVDAGSTNPSVGVVDLDGNPGSLAARAPGAGLRPAAPRSRCRELHLRRQGLGLRFRL
jgi:hypothetical protein